MPRVAALVASLSLVYLSSGQTHTKRCTFVDDGFVPKPCGNALTPDQLTQFLATQASQVAQLQSTNPCGFTTCPKMKRDVEFSYFPENEKRQGSMYADTVPVTGDGKGNINAFNGATSKRGLEERKDALSDGSGTLKDFNEGATSKRDLEERQNMLSDAVPVTGDGSGNLNAFNNGVTSKRDLEERLNMLSDAVPVTGDGSGNLNAFNKGATSKRALEPETVIDTRSLSHEELLERGIELDEDELIARNLPTMRTADGRLVLFGSRNFVPPEPVKRDLVDELHEKIRRGEVEPEVERESAERSIGERDFVDAEDEDAVIARSLSHEELLERGIELDEDELIARNLPTMRTADGRLVLFGSRNFVPPEPVKRDLVDELHEKIRRGEVEPEVERELVERSISERDFIDAEDEDALIARNLPVGRDENGKLYHFGTRSPAAPVQD